MSSSTAQRGRPRSATSRSAVLEATLRLLVSRGYEALSIEAIAVEAGVGKTTIYRWWRTRADIAVEAFFEDTKGEIALGDTASAANDFRAQITALALLLSGARGNAFAEMLGGSRHDPALGRALRERWLNPRRAWGFNRMSRAATEGQLRPGVQIGAALALLYSPLYTPLLFDETTPSDEALGAILELALSAIFNGEPP